MMLSQTNLGGILAADDPMSHVVPHVVTELHLGGLTISITNQMLTMSIAAVLMLIIFTYIGSKARTNAVPTGIANFFEAIASFLRTEVFRPALKDNTDRFAPFLWTVFFFILLNNLLGMIPVGAVIDVIKGKPMHLWGTANSAIMTTAGLAIISFITIHISGIIQQIRIQMDPSLDPHHHGHGGATGGHAHTPGDHHEDLHDSHRTHDAHAHALPAGKPLPVAVPLGVIMYVWNFAPHPDTGVKLLDILLWAFLLILEGIGALVKPFALAVRLFANMLAGHLVLGSLIGLIPVGAAVAGWVTGSVGIVVVLGCTALSLLELFVAFLQAYIFTFLTTLFIASAVAPEH